MKGGSRPLGYTIIEVLIVLAISGVMFVIAATFISGKQARTAFTVGTNDLQSQVQSVISQVIDGSYSDVAIKCDSNGVTTTVSVGGTGQGTNQGCVFLGKVIYFDDKSVGPNYEVLSLAGARLSTAAASQTLKPSDYAPAVIDPLTSDKTVSQDLTVGGVTETDAATGKQFPYTAIAFLQGLGSTDSTGQFKSGAQNVSLYYVDGVTASTGNGIGGIIDGGGNLKPASDVIICVSDKPRYAELTIGLGATDELTVNESAVTIC